MDLKRKILLAKIEKYVNSFAIKRSWSGAVFSFSSRLGLLSPAMPAVPV